MKIRRKEDDELNDFIVSLLNVSTYFSAVLIILIGCLVAFCLVAFPFWYILNTVIYKRIKGVTYFVQFIRYKKEFIEWHKQNKQ